MPPREQPAHAARRSLIAALAEVRDRNVQIPDPSYRDHVSIVTYDTVDGTQVVLPLTTNYAAAMQVAAELSAASDLGKTTATESGLLAARNHMRTAAEGGSGRDNANRIVILLTDGVPNEWESATTAIDGYMAQNSNSNFYGGGYYWLDGPLMQASLMHEKRWKLYPVGIGLGTDYDFMDRMARMGATAGKTGLSPRGSGNPAEYEQRLTDILDEILSRPQIRLVD